jgi:gliding motility-associated-like protein
MITDGCGTYIDTTVDITVSAPTANFSFVQDATEIQFYNLSFSNIVNYAWTFYKGTSIEKDPLQKINYDVPHDVWLLVKNRYGCLDSIKKTVKPPLLVYAPNSFTPNGDGINDAFRFKGVGIKLFNLLIYNRWGELVFETDNIDKGWDGTYNDLKVPSGVYVYKVRAESYKNIKQKEVSKFNLIK